MPVNSGSSSSRPFPRQNVEQASHLDKGPPSLIDKPPVDIVHPPKKAAPPTSFAPSLSARDLLEGVFDWTPPSVQLSGTQTKSNPGSKTTRPPQFYDQHMHKDLQLKKVVVLKHLPMSVAASCDYVLKSGSDHPIHSMPLSHNRSAVQVGRRRLEERGSSTGMKGESLVVREYAAHAKVFSKVASTLAFDRNDWTDIFDWNKDPYEGLQQYAKADGFLCVTGRTHTEEAKVSTLTRPQQADVEVIKKHQLCHLALGEFKSASAADKKAMESIVGLEGDFDWQECNIGRSESNKGKCSNKHEKNGRFNVTGRRTGPDSVIIHTLLDDARNRSQQDSAESSVKGKGSDLRSFWPSLKSGKVDAQKLTTVPEASSANATRTGSTNSMNRKSGMSPRSARQKEEQAAHAGKKNILKATSISGTVKPLHILQQIWAEAVLNDCSVIIIHSGRFEIICIRERETGTLYLSDVIEVTSSQKPAHGKLHIGLYLISYRDTLERAKHLENLLRSKAPSTSWPRLYHLTFGEESYPPRFSLPSLLKGNTDPVIHVYQLFLEDEKHSTTFMFRAPKEKHFRSARIDDDTIDHAEKFSGWYIDALLAEGKNMLSRPRVLNTLVSKGNYCVSDTLIIKLAYNDRQHQELLWEHKFHKTFSEHPFGVRSFGVYRLPADSDSYSFLLMEHSGENLVSLIERNRIGTEKDYLKELTENASSIIHATNWVHGNLDKSHLLVKDNGISGATRIAFISPKNVIRVAPDRTDAFTPEMQKAWKDWQVEQYKDMKLTDFQTIQSRLFNF